MTSGVLPDPQGKDQRKKSTQFWKGIGRKEEILNKKGEGLAIRDHNGTLKKIEQKAGKGHGVHKYV